MFLTIFFRGLFKELFLTFKPEFMKKCIIILSITVLGIFLIQSCDTQKEVVKNVPEDKLEKTYTISKTDTLSVKLTTNPTTGFKWYLVNKIKPKVIIEFDREFVKNDMTMDAVGAGGFDIWRFLPEKKGETYLHFSYQREDGKINNEKFLKIVVTE